MLAARLGTEGRERLLVGCKSANSLLDAGKSNTLVLEVTRGRIRVTITSFIYLKIINGRGKKKIADIHP